MKIIDHLRAKISMDPHFDELLKKGAVAIILRFVGAGLTFLFLVYLARLLGSTDFGLYMLSLTVVTVLSVCVRMGLDLVLVRQISAAIEFDNFTLARSYFGAAIWLVIIVGLIVTVLGVFVMPITAIFFFDKPGLAPPLRLMMFLLLPLSVAFLIAEALKGLKLVADSMIVQSILIPGFSLAILVIGGQFFAWGLAESITIYVVSAFAAAIYAWMRWQSKMPKGEKIRIESRRLLRAGFPLLLATSGGLVMSWSDTIILGMYETTESVGVYVAASRIALLSSLILIAVNSIAAPKFSSLFSKNDIDGLAKLARQSATVTTVLAVFPTVLILLFPQWFLQLFGQEFTDGSTALVILSIGQFINVACGSVGYLLSMTGNELIFRNIMLSTACINIALNLIFVQTYGVEGVAIATAISTALWNIWMVLAVRKKFGFYTVAIFNQNKDH